MGEPSAYERIYRVVQQIPQGKVATYGQVARLAGLPGRARQVGYALFRIAPGATVPWQRVINAKGEISESPHRLGNDDYQRVLLEAEGIVFDFRGQVEFSKYLWQPEPGALLPSESEQPA